jgi:hypothetical protein
MEASMSQPLTYWYCDVCGEKIENVVGGYVIWKSGGLKAHGFKIIHQGKCDTNEYPSSAALSDFLGHAGLAYLFSKLSLGPVMLNNGQSSHCQIEDFDEFVDFMRRVQVPHYEEARRHFNNRNLLEDLSDANEVYPYLPEQLESISNKY